MQQSLQDAVREHGLEPKEVQRQLALFEKGISAVRLKKPATLNDGIIALDEDELKDCNGIFENQGRGLAPVKFVPASGAASRMFKYLEALLNNFDSISNTELAEDTSESRFGKKFIEHIRDFAFWDELKSALARDDFDAEQLLREKKYRTIIEYVLTDKGLNYAALPKALISFHAYDNDDENSGSGKEVRSSLEEHFVEGKSYARDHQGNVRLHFTVSPEFEEAVRAKISRMKKKYTDDHTRFEVKLSFQEPATDTIAADENNQPFLDDNGKVLFRPGGHGALLSNLDRIHHDIVFIKNIDNVVPDHLKPATYTWKKALGGYLCKIRRQVFEYLEVLEHGDANLDEITSYCRETLSVPLSGDFDQKNEEAKSALLTERLNRPIRVCGMVKNEGEPGGGPFWVEHADGRISLQIVESSQVDLNNDSQYEILQSATHFNPVDLVCTLRDYKGRPFELENYADPDTAFIADKTYNGRKLKALERPGLWNGAMADWITVFVEVPIETFNPVKTINDLLRPQHQ